MNNVIIWTIVVTITVIFSIFSRISAYEKNKWIRLFFDTWRDFICYFIAVIIGYFFISIRWNRIQQTGDLSINDFVLFIVFLFAILGWLPYLVKSIAEGIDKVLKKLID